MDRLVLRATRREDLVNSGMNVGLEEREGLVVIRSACV